MLGWSLKIWSFGAGGLHLNCQRSFTPYPCSGLRGKQPGQANLYKQLLVRACTLDLRCWLAASTTVHCGTQDTGSSPDAPSVPLHRHLRHASQPSQFLTLTRLLSLGSTKSWGAVLHRTILQACLAAQASKNRQKQKQHLSKSGLFSCMAVRMSWCLEVLPKLAACNIH